MLASSFLCLPFELGRKFSHHFMSSRASLLRVIRGCNRWTDVERLIKRRKKVRSDVITLAHNFFYGLAIVRHGHVSCTFWQCSRCLEETLPRIVCRRECEFPSVECLLPLLNTSGKLWDTPAFPEPEVPRVLHIDGVFCLDLGDNHFTWADPL